MHYNPDIRPESMPADELRERLNQLERDQRTGARSSARNLEMNRIKNHLSRPVNSK